MNQEPYIKTIRTIEEFHYNPEYGDERICECGHSYYRHFDSYEEMSPIGCKYCQCFEFVEIQDGKDTIADAGDQGYKDGKAGLRYLNPYAQYGSDGRWHEEYKTKYNYGLDTYRDLGNTND
ncbi:hypothetical protein [Yersinia phage fHe-Yen9-04]|uniref:Uncharacterized protein n=2 Tax=Eneladusvirus Yen904 TaxID=2560849 RepID=A0A2C9CXS4_9CAUD|nr:hypothetical protein FDJ41_gp353 [Yersinia phage fHe-Yen9-04]SOK58630.1 hypothetical protein [Yersinia phage fHe-Yen9-04]SOK59162.1 hypothetical protein [Yersinia phage fHe-Yen9-03]VUE36399.1 hypothetical protein [Yersinia phage fHe-Yen9-04]